MNIMKIFTILLILTIVILGFNLIKVETFQYMDKDSCEQNNGKWKQSPLGPDLNQRVTYYCDINNGDGSGGTGTGTGTWTVTGSAGTSTVTGIAGTSTGTGSAGTSSNKEDCEKKNGVWTKSEKGYYCGEEEYVAKETQCYDIELETDCKDTCKWVVGPGGGGYCEDSKACTAVSKSKDKESCETADGLCEWNTEMSICGEKDSCGSPSRKANGAACESDGKCKWIQIDGGSSGFCGELPGKLYGTVDAVVTTAALTTVENPQTYCGFSNYDTTNFEYNTCLADCGGSRLYDGNIDEKCDSGECDKLCKWYERQNIIENGRKNSFKEVTKYINEQYTELKTLQSELPDNIGALLDKEEYLLRALDSMSIQDFKDTDTIDDTKQYECNQIIDDNYCPREIISKFNRNILNLNYVSTPVDANGKKKENECIVTINLDKDINGNINKLIVRKDTNDKLILEANVNSYCDDVPGCGHFILRKICDPRQYIDLYDQYTEKYFVADPNIDYYDLYILQPYNYQNYSLHVDNQLDNVVLLLNNLSGNKNEQFERRH
jgi:hypothetical protein